MTATAIIFMTLAWVLVLGIMGWSWSRLLRSDASPDIQPPPGTSL